jgi:hypothetical protein
MHMHMGHIHMHGCIGALIWCMAIAIELAVLTISVRHEYRNFGFMWQLIALHAVITVIMTFIQGLGTTETMLGGICTACREFISNFQPLSS